MMSTGSKPTLITAEPQLFVADIASTCAWFTERLGFSVAFTWGDPAFHAQVTRDGAHSNLRCVVEPVADPARCEREHLLAASFAVATRADIDALFHEFQTAGVDFVSSLEVQGWGAADFIERDPDGNPLHFAGPKA